MASALKRVEDIVQRRQEAVNNNNNDNINNIANNNTNASNNNSNGLGRPQSQPSIAAQLAAHARRITGQLAAAQSYAEQYRKLAEEGGERTYEFDSRKNGMQNASTDEKSARSASLVNVTMETVTNEEEEEKYDDDFM